MSTARVSKTYRGQVPTTSGTRLLVALTAWMLASVAAGLATNALAKSVAPDWASDPHNLAVVITAEVYALLVASLLLVVGGGDRNRTALAIKPVRGKEVLIALAALGCVYVVSVLGYAVAGTLVSLEPSATDVILGIGSDAGRLGGAGFWTRLLIIGRVLVLVPLGEELLFRGALFGWLRRRLSARWAIGISSLLFAGIHQIPIILPAAFLGGVAFAWLRERTTSVVPGIVAHSINGLLFMLLSYLATDWAAPLPI